MTLPGKCLSILLGFLFVVAGTVAAQESEDSSAEKAKPSSDSAKEAAAPKDPPGLVRLTKDYDLWIDLKRKYVVVDAVVCLREGPLEMFACRSGTKEHEAVVSIECPARYIHAGLEAIGAKAGSTVKWNPTYVPAKGPTIDLWVLWKDKGGMNRKMRAQQWLRNVNTRKAMKFDWVFAGSGFWKDERTGEEHYSADGGDVVCVSNFSTAMLDLPIDSSQNTGELLFEAFTENIPTRGTQVRLVMIPQIMAKPKQPKKPQAAEDKE